MTRVGVTGHQQLTDAVTDYVVRGIRGVLADFPTLTGYSCLATGADQLFAVEVLAVGGELHVVVPCDGYPATFGAAALTRYHRLCAAATATTRLPFSAPDEAAFHAAGRFVAEQCEVLVAVWDGQPARGLGGTGDVVAHARDLRRDVRVIWPPGFTREGRT